MPIKGDLGRIDLANIFQMLTLNQNEGTLHIFYGGVHKQIYFTGSGVIIPYDQDTMDDRVISLLVRQGKISEEQVERARYNTNTLNTGLIGALTQMNFVTEQDIHSATVSQMEEDIYDLFLVKEAQFEFMEGEKPTGGQTMDEFFTLSPNSLLMEAVRRGDEWAHIRESVPSEVEVFEIIDPTLPEGVDDENGEYPLIMNALDGVRSIKSVIQETRLHRFTVFKKCSVLVEYKKIAPADMGLLTARADECIRAGRTQDAIDLYERAIAAGIDDTSVYDKVGNAYVSISENRKAVQHFYKLCDQLESRGMLKQAIKTYDLIRDLLPTEIVARERIFQLFLYNRELFDDSAYDAVAEGTALALIFKEIGRSESAMEVLQLLLEAYREDNLVLEDLAKVALDIRSPTTALKILEHLGDRLLHGKDSTNALRIYRRIKCIDPEHRGIDDKLDRLIESDLVDRKKRGRMIKTSLLIILLLGMVGVYFMFNSFAFDAFKKINYDDLMGNNQFDEARERYERFCARFPLSIYWFLARERLSNIRSAAERHRIAEDLRLKYDEEERLASQRNAENLLADAETSLNSSDLATALRLLKKAAAAATDPDWVRAKDIKKKITSLEAYFTEAENLKESAAKLREAGKYAEAHGLLARLCVEYGDAPSVADVTLPLLVKSNPSGARVFVDRKEAVAEGGARAAATPAVLDVPPSRTVEISIEKEGFMTERRNVDILTDHTVNFELRFKSERFFDIGIQLAYTPLRTGDALVLGYKNGRIRRFNMDTGEEGWSYTIKELQSLESSVGLSTEKVYFCWGSGRITALGLEDGLPVWEKRLPSTSHLAPLEREGTVFVALDNGRVTVLKPENGQWITDANLKGLPVLDPISWKSGILFAVEDGRIIWLDGKGFSITREQRIAARPTAWFTEGKNLLVGNEKGGIDCFERDTGEVVFSYDTGDARRVDDLVAHGRRIYAVLGGDRVVAIDSTRLQIIGKFTKDGARLNLSPPVSPSSLAVGSSDSMMFLLRGDDLSMIRKYRAEGEINLPGFNMGGFAYFYSIDGILYGLRY